MTEFATSRVDIRRYRAVYHLTSFVASRIPRRLVYPPEYFEIMRLLEAEEAGKNIEELLRRRLCRILRHALETVPYYRRLGLGIEPRELTAGNCERALQSFPFLEKKTVLQQPEAFISSRYNPDRLLKGATSGSTGQGAKIFSTYRLTLSLWAFYHHAWSKIGFRPGCRFVRIGADAARLACQDPFTHAYNKLYISPTHLNDTWRDRILDAIGQHGAEFVHAYPSCIAYLADHSAQQGRTFPMVKGLFLASERIFERQLDLLERVFPNAAVRFGYGLSERTNLAWGERTSAGIRYRIEPAYGLTEPFVHRDGRCEIAGTSYWNEVTPLIRYRTQDFGAIRDHVIEHLDGRDQEFLTTRQGQSLAGTMFGVDHFSWDYIEGLMMIQNLPGEIELHVKPRPTYTHAAGERILRLHQERWGDWFTFSLVLEKELPRTGRGKQHSIVNNLARRQLASSDSSQL